MRPPGEYLGDEYVMAGRPRDMSQVCLRAVREEREDFARDGMGRYDVANLTWWLMLWRCANDCR